MPETTEPTTAVEVHKPAAPLPAGRLSRDELNYIVNTEIIPTKIRGKKEIIYATVLKGRALGLDDIHALSAIHFIEGKATLSAETMVTLVRRQGHSIVWEAKPGESCKVTGTRRDNADTGSVTWTMAMAKDAGLVGKDNWKRYPDSMLFARAVSQLCRMLFADVLMGVSYTPDEGEEVAERGRVTQAVADLPVLEEQKVRTEPLGAASEAQLNRIAALEERTGEGYRVVLRGVFGEEMASDLDADAAGRYEAMLEMALQNSAGGSGTAEEPTGEAGQEVAGGSPSAETDSDAVDAETPATPAASEDLPDEPEPEVVDAELVEETDERLVELAGETELPIGEYKGTKLADIHDGWIKYGLENIGRLPAPFAEALELWARERKPEIWKQVRGE